MPPLCKIFFHHDATNQDACCYSIEWLVSSTSWYYFLFKCQSPRIASPIEHIFNASGLVMWLDSGCMLSKLLSELVMIECISNTSTVWLWTNGPNRIISVFQQNHYTFFAALVIKYCCVKLTPYIYKVFSVTSWFNSNFLTFYLYPRNSGPCPWVPAPWEEYSFRPHTV